MRTNLSKVIKLQGHGTQKGKRVKAAGQLKQFQPFEALWSGNGAEGAGLDPDKFLKKQLNEAQGQAAGLVESAKAEAVKIRDDAYQEGFAGGERAGREAAVSEYTEKINQLKALLNQLNEKALQIDRHFNADFLTLVKTMVDRLVNHEVSVNPNVVQATLEKALRYVVENCMVKVSLHANDFNRLKQAGLDNPKLLEGRNRIQLIEDPSITEGGCLLSTDFGEIDSTLENRRELLYQAVDQAFMESLARDDEEAFAPERGDSDEDVDYEVED